MKPSPSMGFRCQVSGVGRKGESSDNQELNDPRQSRGLTYLIRSIGENIGAQSCRAPAAPAGGQEISFI